jgi:hypothetical protein
MLAVKGKEPWVKGLHTCAAGWARAVQTKDFFVPLTVRNHERPFPLFQGSGHDFPKVLCWQHANNKFYGVFIVTAQGHTCLQGREPAVNAGFTITPTLSLGQHLLVKAFPSSHLGCQDDGAFSFVPTPNLVHDGLPGLARQLSAAFRAVLGTEFAV